MNGRKGGGNRDGPKLALQVPGCTILAELTSRDVAGLKHVHHLVAPGIARARLVDEHPQRYFFYRRSICSGNSNRQLVGVSIPHALEHEA